MEFIAKYHPQIVHFPIAFLIVYSAFELTGAVFKREFLSKVAHIFLFLGVVGLIGAVLTGEQAEHAAEALQKKGVFIPEDEIHNHADYANYSLWFFAALLVFRTLAVLKKKFTSLIKYIFAAVSLIGVFLIYETSEHGGKLVYKYGIGTEILKEKSVP